MEWTDESSWPPEKSFGSSIAAVIVQGKLNKTTGYAKKIKKKTAQKGYLRSKKTADVVSKYCGFEINITSVSGKNQDLFVADIDTFYREKLETDGMVRGNTVTLLAHSGTVASIASTSSESQALCVGDELEFTMRGDSVFASDVAVVRHVSREADQIGSLKKETHMYSNGGVNVDTGFSANVFQAKSLNSSHDFDNNSIDVQEDEWN